MCLILRAIVLLSLPWWVTSVGAQEKQDLSTTSTVTPSQVEGKQDLNITSTVTPQASGPAIQAQSPTEIKKPEEVKAPEQETKKTEESQKPESTSVKTTADREKPAEAKAEQPVQQPAEVKKPEEIKKIEEIKKSETMQSPAESKQEAAQAPAEAKQEAQQSPAESKQEVVQSPVEVKKEEESKKLEREEEEIKGIDTVDLEEPRGNWLFKRIWWNRAENKYEKIRTLFGNILEARLVFFNKRSTADRDLFAPFYFEIGMSNGELQETVSQLLKHIEKERKQEGALSMQARDMLNVLMREKKSLESINADVVTVNKLDDDINGTLKQLIDQIERARKYEREAWNSFKDIAHVLSDKKARELFYQMDTAYNNLKDIQEYIGQALSVHLDKVVGMAKNQIERIKSTIAKLNQEGHDLRTLADEISGNVSTKPEVVEEEEIEPEEEEEQGFFARTFSVITSGIVGIWDAVVYVVTWPFSWFTSSESSEQEAGEEYVSESEEEKE